KFLLVFKGGDPTPETKVTHMEEWKTWIQGLTNEGKYESGMPFAEEQKKVQGPENHVSSIIDGAGGYMVVNLDSFNEALDIARSAPHQHNGGYTEVYSLMEADSKPQQAFQQPSSQ
ncbi:hypothetical protein A3I55_03760, partial [Candidatus Woesebacteria bacterium RIFCSPLOWO2_02_FULL_42_10]